jgi:hypothetical protein
MHGRYKAGKVANCLAVNFFLKEGWSCVFDVCYEIKYH